MELVEQCIAGVVGGGGWGWVEWRMWTSVDCGCSGWRSIMGMGVRRVNVMGMGVRRVMVYIVGIDW